MKHTLLYIPVLAALFGFAACSSDNDITGGEDIQTGNAVIINASVGNGSVFTRSNPVGTEEEQKKFNEYDMIDVSDGTNNARYMYYAWRGTNYTWSGITVSGLSEYLTWHSSPTTFQAYYPSQGGQTTNAKWNKYYIGYLYQDQSNLSNLAESDYMKVEKSVDKEPNDHTLSLEFERQTARVIVKIAGYNNQYDASTTSVTGVKVYSELTVPGDGNYSAITTYKNGEEYVALVCPTSGVTGQQFLEITVKPNGGETTETLTVTGIPAMEAGKSYTYNITVGKDKATIEDVTVTDWTTGNVISGGEAKEYVSP